MELQVDSSNGTFGSKSSLALTVEEDEVRTTRLRFGFFLHERSTFKVPSMAGSRISACNANWADDIIGQFQTMPSTKISSICFSIFFYPAIQRFSLFLRWQKMTRACYNLKLEKVTGSKWAVITTCLWISRRFQYRGGGVEHALASHNRTVEASLFH